MNNHSSDISRSEDFLLLVDKYKDVIAKVCSVYSSTSAPFADLYQEVLANLWSGLDSYRADAKVSTWIYRVAINTCITWHRRNNRYSDNTVSLDGIIEPVADDSDTVARYSELYGMISRLEPLEKAIVTLWLDEKSYEEISAVTGLSKANVATRMHRIRAKLSKMAQE